MLLFHLYATDNQQQQAKRTLERLMDKDFPPITPRINGENTQRSVYEHLSRCVSFFQSRQVVSPGHPSGTRGITRGMTRGG